MVNYCVICKKGTSKGCGKSIHRMPCDNARRKLWMDQLKLKSGKSKKELYVCSDHFGDEDFLYKSGKRFLKAEAIPSSISLSLHCSSSTSAALDERPVTQEQSDDNMNNLGSVGKSLKLSGSQLSRTSTATDLSATLTASDLSATLTVSDLSATLTPSDLSATLTASESSSTLTASESSSKLVSSEVIDSKVFTVPHPTSSEAKSTEKRATKRKCFVGDVTDEDFRSPKQGKFVFSLAKKKIEKQKKALQALRMKNRRLRQKISDLSGLLNSLREMNFISDNAQDHIEALLPGPSRDMVNRLIRGSKSQKFNPSLRAFALTLHFYSPRAYNYVREKFNNSLPHPKTISKWYQTVDGNPGFTTESLNALKIKVQQSAGEQIYCNLVIDEMSIRKKIEFIAGKFYGSISFGDKTEVDTLPEAKETLVFLVTCINGHWKIPVGYFLIDGLSSREKANLVINCLEFLNGANLKISNKNNKKNNIVHRRRWSMRNTRSYR